MDTVTSVWTRRDAFALVAMVLVLTFACVWWLSSTRDASGRGDQMSAVYDSRDRQAVEFRDTAGGRSLVR
jgi:hypothetical protein